MKPLERADPDRVGLDRIRTVLDPYAGPEDDPEPRPGGWVASVAVILREGAGPRGTELLLIRRSRLDRDPWSGHMAFPGGRRDRVDPSLLATAVRETREEVALCLDQLGEPLGRLDAVAPLTPALPPLTILPLVFRVPTGTGARVASPEVAEIHWTTLAHLADPRNRMTVLYKGGGAEHSFPAIQVRGRHVWGLTHRILTDLLGRIG